MARFKELRKHPRLPFKISRCGEIFSIKTGVKRKLWRTKRGYLQLSIRGTSYLAHRLIADVYLPNPENKPNINHKNGVTSDNRVSNLEWVTQRENIIHARDILNVDYGRKGVPKKVTKSEDLIIVRMYNIGLTISEISHCVGYCSVTVTRRLSALGRTIAKRK